MKMSGEVQETRMGKWKQDSRGFTLIAALMLLVLLSALAIGVMFLVTNEGHMSTNEQEDNLAYYGAQSGIEKMTADLAALYQTSMSPQNSQIQNLVSFPPDSTMVGSMNYVEAINYKTDANGNPVSSPSTVSAGSNAGLYAEIIPMTLSVTASRPSGASVNISRTVEVALIPVFQFGVFCGYDCSYFPGPNFSFGGRVHTNGSLFLAAGGDLVFNDKIAAFQQVVMDQLENGHATSSGYGGTVYVSTSSGGCPLNSFPPSGTNCLSLPSSTTSSPGDASWTGSHPPLSGGSANPNFPTVSAGTLKGYVVNSLTGATNMQLPFVANSCTSNPPPCTDPIQIIRKPVDPTESPTSTIGQSRLYNKAQIRILLADTVADLHPERGPGQLDLDDVNFIPGASQPVATAYTTAGAAAGGNQYYGMAQPTVDRNWIPPINPATGTQYTWKSWPLLGEITTSPANSTSLNAGQGAWLRVEYIDAFGTWHGITRDWLQYGFGRSYNIVPTGPAGAAGHNAINPNAILVLQQLSPTATSPTSAATNWYPINFYDTREGQPRDTTTNGCTVNGIMNAVEIDVGNLALWLSGRAPYGGDVGKQVNVSSQNGYVLYFSDRRGMLPDPNAPAPATNKTYGESGLEDVVNWSSTNGVPDGILENTAQAYYTYSPEDVDQNGRIDNWGGKNIGNGFNVNTTAAPASAAAPNPYLAVPNPAIPPFPAGSTGCNTYGQANAVTGARHVLKLVDGSLGNVPVRWDTTSGGFTIASENPVYVQGNYNSSSADPFWSSNFTNTTTPHSAAAIIADSVTLLSNQWSDINSLKNPTAPGSRAVTADAYYRMAVAAGKNIPFPQPSWGGQDMGTDGGLHNFLRYLESWGKPLHYDGSLVSMYYSEYDTGIFKCCTTVYSPPTRDYHFDVLFLNPANLPPATPTFQDIDNLSYRQSFQPQ